MYESDVGLMRANAAAVLVEVSAKKTLDSGTSQAVRQIILHALHDPSESTRITTVDVLGKFGGEDMVPALREVEESDPSAEVQGLSIRAEATKAIEAIHKRSGGN
jgi:HEAT repeat protein